MNLKSKPNRLAAISQLRLQLGQQQGLAATIARHCTTDGLAQQELTKVGQQLTDLIRLLQPVGEKDV